MGFGGNTLENYCFIEHMNYRAKDLLRTKSGFDENPKFTDDNLPTEEANSFHFHTECNTECRSRRGTYQEFEQNLARAQL